MIRFGRYPSEAASALIARKELRYGRVWSTLRLDGATLPAKGRCRAPVSERHSYACIGAHVSLFFSGAQAYAAAVCPRHLRQTQALLGPGRIPGRLALLTTSNIRSPPQPSDGAEAADPGFPCLGASDDLQSSDRMQQDLKAAQAALNKLAPTLRAPRQGEDRARERISGRS